MSAAGNVRRRLVAAVQRRVAAPDRPRAYAVDGRATADEPATLDDVFNCYRLFLQRNPDPVGWGAYADQVAKGIRVGELISYFVGCPEWIERGLYRASGNTSLKRVETADFALYVIAADPVVARELIATRDYEPHLSGRLRGRITPGQTFVDVGANVGFYSLLAARQVGDSGRVIAFEPNPDNLKPLLLNKMSNGCEQIEVRPFAVSDEEGFLSLMKIVSIASTKALRPEELEFLNDAQVVWAVSLDRALRDEARVDVLKCDIDGHDFRAMLGARGALERFRPLVVAEFNPGTLRACSDVEPVDYLRLFFALGYRATVLMRDHEPLDCGDDAGRILEVVARRGADQVDLWLEAVR